MDIAHRYRWLANKALVRRNAIITFIATRERLDENNIYGFKLAKLPNGIMAEIAFRKCANKIYFVSYEDIHASKVLNR